MQEVGSWPDGRDFGVDGFSAFRSVDCQAAVILHWVWVARVSSWSSPPHFASFTLDRSLVVISVYLPDSSNPDVDFLEALGELSAASQQFTVEGITHRVVAGDLQVELAET